jgi:hypothetical protein
MFPYTLRSHTGTLLARTHSPDAITAIQWLFTNFPSPPPASAIHLTQTRGNLLHYAVGPFEIIVEQGDD